MPDDPIEQIREGWRRERPDLPTRSVPVISLIWRLSRRLTAERAALLTDLGVDQATLELLANLRRSGAPYQLTPSTLADRCGVSPAAISLRIRRAEAEGWVVRSPGATDGRTTLVTLTDSGVRTADRYAGQILRHDDQLLAPLSDEDLTTLETLLRRLEQTITR